MPLVQKWRFLQLFVLGHIQQDNAFYDIVKRKKAFLGYKKQEIQNNEKLIFFFKGLTNGFGPKKVIFRTFFEGNIAQENILLDILKQKTPLSSF